MGDIRIQHRRITLDRLGTSGSAAIDPVDTTKAFVRVRGFGGSGAPNGVFHTDGIAAGKTGSNLHIGCVPKFVDSGTIAVTRTSPGMAGSTSGDTTDYDLEVWEYTGPVGGPNEFEVRDFSTIVVPSGNTQVAKVITGGGAEATDFTPILCGYEDTIGLTSLDYRSWRTSMVNFFGFLMTVANRGVATFLGIPIGGNISIASVKFIGSNWSNRRVDYTPPQGDDTFKSIALAPSVDWDHTLIHAQTQRGDGHILDQDRDDWVVFPGDGTASGVEDGSQMSFWRPSVGPDSRSMRFYLLENSEMETVYSRSDVARRTLSGTGESVIQTSGESTLPWHDPPLPSVERTALLGLGHEWIPLAFTTYKNYMVSESLSGTEGELLGAVRGSLDAKGWAAHTVSFPSVVTGAVCAAITVSGTPNAIFGVAASGCVDITAGGLLGKDSGISAGLCVSVTMFGDLGPCDWFESEAPGWLVATSGSAWKLANGTSWFKEKDCA